MSDPYTEQAAVMAALSAENGLLCVRIERLATRLEALQLSANHERQTCKAAEAEIERLRIEGSRFADWIDELYSGLPRDRAPGPPITLLREMRATFGHHEQRSDK